MKKICAVYMGLILLSLPHVVSGQENFTGHHWRIISMETKVYLLRGYMDGYRYGVQLGSLMGVADGIGWVRQKVCKDLKSPACIAVKKVIEAEDPGHERLALTLNANFEKTHVAYYVNELDAFYEAFPLCRGKDLSSIMADLVTVWSQVSSVKRSYNEIGTECGGQKR